VNISIVVSESGGPRHSSCADSDSASNEPTSTAPIQPDRKLHSNADNLPYEQLPIALIQLDCSSLSDVDNLPSGHLPVASVHPDCSLPSDVVDKLPTEHLSIVSAPPDCTPTSDAGGIPTEQSSVEPTSYEYNQHSDDDNLSNQNSSVASTQSDWNTASDIPSSYVSYAYQQYAVNDRFNCVTAYMTGPGCFYVQPAADTGRINELTDQLNYDYSREDVSTTVAESRVFERAEMRDGMICCAHSKKDNRFVIFDRESYFISITGDIFVMWINVLVFKYSFISYNMPQPFR